MIDRVISSSLMDSFKGLLSSGASFLQTRLELFSVELQEEKRRCLQILVLSALGIGFGTISLAAITLTGLLLMLQGDWIKAVLSLGCVFGALTMALILLVRRKLLTPPFEASRQELEKDQQCLQPNNRHS